MIYISLHLPQAARCSTKVLWARMMALRLGMASASSRMVTASRQRAMKTSASSMPSSQAGLSSRFHSSSRRGRFAGMWVILSRLPTDAVALRGRFVQDGVLLRGEDEPAAAGVAGGEVALEVAAGGGVAAVLAPAVVHLEDLGAAVAEGEMEREGGLAVLLEEADLVAVAQEERGYYLRLSTVFCRTCIWACRWRTRRLRMSGSRCCCRRRRRCGFFRVSRCWGRLTYET